MYIQHCGYTVLNHEALVAQSSVVSTDASQQEGSWVNPWFGTSVFLFGVSMTFLCICRFSEYRGFLAQTKNMDVRLLVGPGPDPS